MKTVLIVALVLTGSLLKAQEEKGINFEKGLSWAQVKEKAKKENKYIFVDAYTTWCAPCRMMAKEIFPQPKVGEFFNKNFINVAVQFDVTKKDNQEVKSWYKDAKLLKETYKVESFPTYLFFNPDGEHVHTIYGSMSDADVFIAKAHSALVPATQYGKLKAEYDAGNRSPEFLRDFIKAVRRAQNFRALPSVINEYLATQNDLLTDQNLRYIAEATSKSTDPGYSVLKNHGDRLDAAAGKGKAVELLKKIAFDEILLPRLRTGGRKIDHGGIIEYQGELNARVNWVQIWGELDKQYPELAEEIIMAAKPTYFQWGKNWVQFAEAVSAYAEKYQGGSIDNELNQHAWTVFATVDDEATLNAALKWSKKTLSGRNENNLAYLYTYGNLLYKAGKKEEAISTIGQMAKLIEPKDPRLEELMTKMKGGEKVW